MNGGVSHGSDAGPTLASWGGGSGDGDFRDPAAQPSRLVPSLVTSLGLVPSLALVVREDGNGGRVQGTVFDPAALVGTCGVEWVPRETNDNTRVRGCRLRGYGLCCDFT